jgi:hypothetical protein
LLGTTFVILVCTAILNYAVDPAGIYRSGRINPQVFADALVVSKIGLWVPDNSFDERLVAKELAKYSSTVDCVVIGSSHVQQISSVRNNSALKSLCTSIINLGVSGAGIEDHFAMAYFALEGGRPQKIILGVDPWTFVFGKDQRWSAYRDDYIRARALISGKRNNTDAKINFKNNMAKLSNLINLEYTVRSARTALSELRRGLPAITAADQLDVELGGAISAQLRDGSHVYPAKTIAEARRINVAVGGQSYMTNGLLNQRAAIIAYREFLLWIRNQGVEPILLMTPYHENVWKAPQSADTLAMRATEPIIADLARDLNVRLIGSYNPQVVGCSSDEFFDHMHPKANCLAKLRIRLPQPLD